MARRVWAVVLGLLAGVILAPAAIILAYRVVPPPVTPLMLLRGGPSDYRWVPLNQIAPALVRSVLTAEDEAFCRHRGFDKTALEKAWDRYQDDEEHKGALRGGSAISQQTAKNVLLWPGRARGCAKAWRRY